MTANFKIIGFDENQGVVIVRYSDVLPPVSVDVPLEENGLYVTGEALNEYITGFIPVEFLARGERIKQGVPNVEDVRNMVEAEEQVEVASAPNPENAIMWANINNEAALAATLVKWGVLAEDPTKIPVATQ